MEGGEGEGGKRDPVLAELMMRAVNNRTLGAQTAELLQHNFGAILRSALFLGVTGVVTCTRNSSPLSAVVSKSSAGALEHMVIRNADKLQQTLAQARKDGWNVLGDFPLVRD